MDNNSNSYAILLPAHLLILMGKFVVLVACNGRLVKLNREDIRKHHSRKARRLPRLPPYDQALSSDITSNTEDEEVQF